MCKTHNHFWSTRSKRYIPHRQMNLRLQQCVLVLQCQDINLTKSLEMRLMHSASKLSPSCLDPSLTRHAAKQTASYLNSAVETAGDVKNIPRRQVYNYSPFFCPWVIACAIYLSVPGPSVTLAICPRVVNR